MDLTEMLRTTDASGNLMPSFLGTMFSEAAIEEGLCEEIIDEETGMPWIRLTARGKRAAENAKAGGTTSVTDPLQTMAYEAFDAIKKNTGETYPHASVKEAYESFQKITTEKGIAWLIDAAAGTGMSHLGWSSWMIKAKTRF